MRARECTNIFPSWNWISWNFNFGCPQLKVHPLMTGCILILLPSWYHQQETHSRTHTHTHTHLRMFTSRTKDALKHVFRPDPKLFSSSDAIDYRHLGRSYSLMWRSICCRYLPGAFQPRFLQLRADHLSATVQYIRWRRLSSRRSQHGCQTQTRNRFKILAMSSIKSRCLKSDAKVCEAQFEFVDLSVTDPHVGISSLFRRAAIPSL